MADLDQVVSIEDLRELARRRLPRAIFDFFDGGAEDEVTLRESRGLRGDARHGGPARLGQARARSAQRLPHAVQPELAQFARRDTEAGVAPRDPALWPAGHGELRRLSLHHAQRN